MQQHCWKQVLRCGCTLTNERTADNSPWNCLKYLQRVCQRRRWYLSLSLSFPLYVSAHQAVSLHHEAPVFKLHYFVWNREKRQGFYCHRLGLVQHQIPSKLDHNMLSIQLTTPSHSASCQASGFKSGQKQSSCNPCVSSSCWCLNFSKSSAKKPKSSSWHKKHIRHDTSFYNTLLTICVCREVSWAHGFKNCHKMFIIYHPSIWLP